jgi:hypothetical protein
VAGEGDGVAVAVLEGETGRKHGAIFIMDGLREKCGRYPFYTASLVFFWWEKRAHWAARHG